MAQIDQAIKLLRSQDRDKRRKAISFLAKSGETKALKALAWSHKNDPDPDLRELARKGGNYLKRQMENNSPAGGSSLMQSYERAREKPQRVDSSFSFEDAGTASSDIDSMFTFDDDGYDDAYDDQGDYDYNDDSFSTSTGPLDYDARRHIKRAMDLHLDGNDPAALEELAQAVDIDMRSRQDDQAQNIAAAVTGLPGGEAMRVVASPLERAELMDELELESSGNGKAKRGDTPGWGTVWMDIGIFTLINVVGVIIIVVLAANRFTPTLRQFQQTPEYQQFVLEAGGVDVVSEVLGALQQTITLLVVIAISIALGTVVYMLIQNFVLHFIASSMFDGKRPVTVTIDRLFNLNSIYYFVSYTLLVGVMFVLPTDYGEFQNVDSTGTLVWTLYANCLNPLLSFGLLIATGVVLGQAQRIGAVKGCLSLVVFVVGMAGIGCCGGFLLGTLGGAAGSGF